MRRINNPIPNGGAPISDDIITGELNLEIWKAIWATVASLAPPPYAGSLNGVILSGCVVTGSGPYNCSAGIVLISGNILEFPGFTAQALPAYVYGVTPTNINKIFGDGASKTLIVSEVAGFAFVPSPNQSLVLSTTGNLGGLGGLRAENIVNSGVIAAISTAVAAEASARSGADTTLQNNINSEASTRSTNDALKANILPSTDWTDIPTDTNGSTTGSNIVQRAQYTKDTFGYVHLRGRIRSIAGITVATSPGNLVLPASFRPPINELRPVINIINDLFGSFSTVPIQINTSGVISVTNSANDIIDLDGISFRV